MKRLFLLLGFFALASQPGCEGDGCDHANCDAQCKAHGFGWGTCEGGSCSCGSFENCSDGIDNDGDGAVDAMDPDCRIVPPAEVCGDGIDNDNDGSIDCWDPDCGYGGPWENACDDDLDNDCDGAIDCYDIGDCSNTPACGACDDAVCSSECRAAGHTGGSCIGGACQCSDNCTSHEQCSATTICYHSSCQDPWGKEYQFTVVNGDFPDVDWNTGDVWDFGGSCPDTHVELTLDSTTCTTPQVDDSCNPTWNYACNFTLFASSRLSWTMLDEDTMDYAVMTSTTPEAVGIDKIKGGGMSWYLDYGGTRYYVLNITISAR